MMKRKKITLIILTITICIINISNAQAASWNIGYASTGSGGGGGATDKGYGVGVIEDTTFYNRSYRCVYNHTHWTNKVVTINGYDINGTSLMETSLNIAKEDAVLAGTSIKFNIYETKEIYWKVTKHELQQLETRKVYNYECTYKEKYPATPIPTPTTFQNDNITLQPLSNVKMIASRCAPVIIETSAPAVKLCKDANPDPSNCEYQAGPKKISTNPIYTWDKAPVTPASSEWQLDSATTALYQKECDKLAIQDAIKSTEWTFSASYEIRMTDSNDVNSHDKTSSSYARINRDNASNTIKCKDKDGNDISCTKWTPAFVYKEGVFEDKITATFEYKINKVCMNAKTGKVAYRTSKCETDELEVENKTIGGKEHWHYFIPLNAKSNSNVEINMLSGYSVSSTGESFAACKYVMQNNPVTLDAAGNVIEESLTGTMATSYTNLIITKDNTSFVGNYCYKYEGSSDVICNESSSDYAEILNKNGCYLTSKVKIPVKQEFYNEVTTVDAITGVKKVTFNGFNFYYKPIDIVNTNQTDIIYPNGVPTDSTTGAPIKSLWLEWYDAQTNPGAYAGIDILDLSKSYDSVTYIAQDINATEIREYTKSNSYTSWSNMNIDGTSKFISDEGIVIKNPSLSTTIYKLGCGPANMNEFLDAAKTIENPLFIKGCET